MTSQFEEHTAILEWIEGGKTGTSSKAIAGQLTGVLLHDNSYPLDSGDFGRCVGLLNAVPSLRARLGDMNSLNAYWAAITPRWNEIEATTHMSGVPPLTQGP